MGRPLSLLAAFFFGAALYLLLTRLHSQNTPLSSELAKPKTGITPTDLPRSLHSSAQNQVSQTIVPRAADPRPKLPPQNNPGLPRDQKPEGNIVEFQVIDGWAVAYGDVLLGKPNDLITHGATEVADLRTWERPEIPYVIHPQLPEPSRVEKAIAYFKANTPVRFVPATPEQKDLIVFETGSENCYSYLGKIGGAQPIRLSAGCGWLEILHEMMHALGFIHEQSRTDRFNFVNVLWDNIDPKNHIQFAIAPESYMEPLRGSPFDYHSLMLYDREAFAAKPGTFTLRSTGSEVIAPSREGLSATDIQRLKILYRAEFGAGQP